MALATIAQVIRNCEKQLTAAHVSGLTQGFIEEAEVITLADLSGLKDIFKIKNYEAPPETLNQLVVYKAREIGYRAYYGRVPADSEIQYYQNEYAKLLKRIEDRLSKIDNFSDSVDSKVEFV